MGTIEGAGPYFELDFRTMCRMDSSEDCATFGEGIAEGGFQAALADYIQRVETVLENIEVGKFSREELLRDATSNDARIAKLIRFAVNGTDIMYLSRMEDEFLKPGSKARLQLVLLDIDSAKDSEAQAEIFFLICFIVCKLHIQLL